MVKKRKSKKRGTTKMLTELKQAWKQLTKGQLMILLAETFMRSPAPVKRFMISVTQKKLKRVGKKLKSKSKRKAKATRRKSSTKKRSTTKRRSSTKKKTKAQIRATRLRNLKKARAAKKRLARA